MDYKNNKLDNLSLCNQTSTDNKVLPLHDCSINNEHEIKIMCADLKKARTLEELAIRIKNIAEINGFTDFLFARLERIWHENYNTGLLYSLPAELMRTYHEQDLFKTDLLLPYGKANTQPIFGSQVYGYINGAPFEMDLTDNNRRLLQLYKRFGYFEHCAVPQQAFNGNGHVMLVLTSAGIQKQDFQSLATPVLSTCRNLCKAIDTVTSNKFKSQFIDKADIPFSIPPKPMDALQRLARSDKPITEIAHDMCISPITAHQHIAAARKALRAKTNIGAIIKAIKAGLIDIDK